MTATAGSIGRRVSHLSGRGLPVRGDDLDTDRIIPARFLRCVTFEGLEEHIFEDDRAQVRARGGTHPLDVEAYRGASILVVNGNFGCGSSREHAPQGLLRWGIQAIVGISFAEIFRGNCVALGVPCVTVSPADASLLQDKIESDPRATLTLDLEALRLELHSSAGERTSMAVTLPAGLRESFLGGTWDATGLLLADEALVRKVASRLPYMRGFS